MPAAAVIPTPQAYTNVAVVKTSVVHASALSRDSVSHNFARRAFCPVRRGLGAIPAAWLTPWRVRVAHSCVACVNLAAGCASQL